MTLFYCVRILLGGGFSLSSSAYKTLEYLLGVGQANDDLAFL